MVKLLKERIKKYLDTNYPLTVAVSGGIDSLTLSIYISREFTQNNKLFIVHATGPAVPEEATERVKFYTKIYNWNLNIINAGEMNDPNYVSNPINRCFYCKTNLYSSISKNIKGNIFSGANLDDLNDFRPGLIAAKNSHVAHPFIEARMKKKAIRKLAYSMGLKKLSLLPSSPCLSSRVETGISIDSKILKKIDLVEKKIRQLIPNSDVRCRWLKKGINIEFKTPSPDRIENKNQIITYTEKTFNIQKDLITISNYCKGSAFKGKKESIDDGQRTYTR